MKDLCCGKINSDNLDIRVNANDIRITNRDKNYNFFASNFVMDRLKPDPSVNPQTFLLYRMKISTLTNSFLVTLKLSVYKDSLKFLLARIMAKHIPGFQSCNPYSYPYEDD